MHLLGVRRALVVHGHDGLDEISVCAPTRVTRMEYGRLRTYDLFPEMYFEELADPAALRGGDARENAEILQAVLGGELGPRRNIVLINAAAALVAAELAEDLHDGIRRSAHAIDTGGAREKLEAVREFLR